MISSILVVMWIVGLLLVLAFVSAAIANVRANVAHNRRISRERQDRQQWERFSSRETK